MKCTITWVVCKLSMMCNKKEFNIRQNIRINYKFFEIIVVYNGKKM